MPAQYFIPPLTSLVARLPALFSRPGFWVTLLALQYALVQLALGVQYGDAPRNLHWAQLVAEDPAFLLGALDPYDRVNGFVPDPPALAPLGLARNSLRTYNLIWGPVPMLLLAPIWWMTQSHTALALIVPLVAGATVLALYRLGCQLFDRRTALAAAIFLALFPQFYERAVVSYVEVISTLALLLAMMAYLRNRTALATLLGIVTALCKLNMAPLYCGIIALSLLYRLWRREGWRRIAQSFVAMSMPALALMGWFWYHRGSPLPPTLGDMSLGQLRLQSMDMLEMLFYIPWYGALLTLAIIGACTIHGLRSPRLIGEVRVILIGWIGFGVFTLLSYMATAYMDNSPRAIIPALPAVALAAAEGWRRLPPAWARRCGFFLIALFLTVNSIITYYDSKQARYYETFNSVWQVLREQPRGIVMTSSYWMTMWQTRQPVTWFEHDRRFERNILHQRAHFERYVTANHIRYVVVPRAGTPAATTSQFIQVDTSDLYGADVLAYLGTTARRIGVPPYYDIYVLPEQGGR